MSTSFAPRASTRSKLPDMKPGLSRHARHEVRTVDYWELFWDTGAPEAWLMAKGTEDEAWTTEHS